MLSRRWWLIPAALLASAGVASADVFGPNSGVSLGAADSRYVNVSGDTMTGALNMSVDPGATCALAAVYVPLAGSGANDLAMCVDGTADVSIDREGDALFGGTVGITGLLTASDVTLDTSAVIKTSAAGTMTLGDANLQSLTVTTDGTGTAEVALPAGAIDSTEVLDGTLVSADLSGTAGITDAQVSDTLTCSLFVGSGSSTTAIDLATAEVAGTLPVANGGSGATSLTGLLVGNGASAFTATTTSAGIAGQVTDEQGSGALVFATSPTLTTPTIGVATATSVNKVALTAPATSATLTIADGKTLTCSNTLTFTGTDSSSVAFGAGGTVAYTANNLSVFAATTSAQLAGVISDEVGSGALCFATSPVITTSLSQDGDVADVGYLRLQNAASVAWEASPAGTDVTLSVDASEILQASGAFNAVGAITGSNLSGTNTGDQTITLTGDVTGSGTGSFAATVAANAVALGTDTTNAYVATATEGLAIDVAGVGAETATLDIAFDPTELTGARTWGDNSADAVWTFNSLTGTDPVVALSNGVVNVSTGTLQQGGVAVVLTSRSLTAGAGLSGGGDLSADRTFATDSSEAAFLASGALTCGAGTAGKMQVHTTALQYCDNAATPALQYAAYGSSTGVATSATALAANGANCSAGSSPLGVDTLGAAESCTDFEEDLANSAGLAAALSDEVGTGFTVFSVGPLVTGTWAWNGGGAQAHFRATAGESDNEFIENNNTDGSGYLSLTGRAGIKMWADNNNNNNATDTNVQILTNALPGGAATSQWLIQRNGNILHAPSSSSITPSATGAFLNIATATVTDSATAGSGTLALAVFTGLAAPTLAATNASVTTTDAATLYLGGVPIAGTNETITNPWALMSLGAGIFGGSKGVCLEGATADGFETCFGPTDPTADNTVTVPDHGGTLVAATGTGTTTTVLHGNASGTTAPAWGAVVLTTDVSGVLPVANGGTNSTKTQVGQCTLNGGSPSTCTASVTSGAICVCSGTTAITVGCSVSSTTLTVTGPNGSSAAVSFLCM